MTERRAVPRNQENDYTREQAAARREFAGTDLTHVGSFSFDPGVLPGNIENFIGVAQVPIGLAGPLRVNGEHANGEYYVPMATTEGTLVASYNSARRGLRPYRAPTQAVAGLWYRRCLMWHSMPPIPSRRPRCLGARS